MVSKVSLNVSGGNKTSTYNLSGSYLNQDGIVNTTGYEAWNIRAKNTFSFFNNHLRMGTTLMMKFYKKKYEDVSYTSALTAVPMWNVYGEDGTWGVAPEWTRGDNPVGWTEAYDYQRHGIDILLNGYAEVDLFLKGLKYKFNVEVTKLLQKSEMRKNMVMDLIYRGFIYAANYSESHYNPRRSQIKTELRYLFVTTPNR